jgi:multicomponent Na+:H+ antiporter subunit G
MALDGVLDLLSWILIGAGALASLIGAIGMLRLPDVYARMHAAGVIDTFGIATIMIGLMLQAGLTLITVKLFLIVGFVFFTSPTTTHALARAAINGGIKPAAKGVTPKAEIEEDEFPGPAFDAHETAAEPQETPR